MKEVISIVRPATGDGIWLGLLAQDIWITIKWVLSTHFSISFSAVSTLKLAHVKVKEEKTKRVPAYCGVRWIPVWRSSPFG